MEQKSYDFEIVLALMKKANHVRGIARLLKTNQMMASRRMKELLEANVVDFRPEGRNKVFFLKKSAEARQYAFIAEHYKLLSLIRKYPKMRTIIDSFSKNSKIGLAVIFGSYAKGSAGPESDIDVYISTKDQGLKREAELIDSRLSIKIGAFDRESILAKEIEKNHVIIKGVEEYYGKTGFFG